MKDIALKTSKFLVFFSSCSSEDSEIPELIQKISKDYDYLVDPHTACGFKDLNPERPSMVLATAHPAKFPSVYECSGMQIPRADVYWKLYFQLSLPSINLELLLPKFGPLLKVLPESGSMVRA